VPKVPRVVADSNVIISAFVFGGVPELLFTLARDGRFGLYLSRFILEEVAGVLARPKFGWKEREIAEALRSFPYTLVNAGRRRLAVVSDPADNRVLECQSPRRRISWPPVTATSLSFGAISGRGS
jgi:predicted nucleic acid-binding protein